VDGAELPAEPPAGALDSLEGLVVGVVMVEGTTAVPAPDSVSPTAETPAGAAVVARPVAADVELAPLVVVPNAGTALDEVGSGAVAGGVDWKKWLEPSALPVYPPAEMPTDGPVALSSAEPDV